MAIWEQVLLGLASVVILFFFWPGVKQVMKQSREAENPDWKGALIPIGMVVLFVILLISFAKGWYIQNYPAKPQSVSLHFLFTLVKHMKNILNILLLSTICMMPVWAEEQGESEEVLSAQELLTGCEEGSLPGAPNQYCMQYVFGLVQTVLGLQQMEQSPLLFCINPQVTRLEQATDNVINFLRSNNSRLDEDAYVLVTEALHKDYPCSQTNI